MKVIPQDPGKAEHVSTEGARGVRLTSLISENDGAENFAMRLFDVQPGGHTPLHEHAWEHEVFIVSGSGELRGKTVMPFAAGDAVFVEPGEVHQFANTGAEALRFICCVPVLEQ